MEEFTSCVMYIDADGVPLWLMEQSIRDVQRRCAESRIHAYRDWTPPGLHPIMESLWRLGVELVQVNPHATRKNGTDIALTIDAVATVHTSPTQAVALVANDGDFSSLARYLSQRGVVVLGYGSHQASGALAAQCARFVHFNPRTRLPDETAAGPFLIDEIIEECVAQCRNDQGWVTLQRLGQAMLTTYGLKAKDAGTRSWSQYLRTSRRFTYCSGPDGIARVRLRSSTSQAA